MNVKPSYKPRVLIYRHTLGKASEPWVWAQSLRYQSYEPAFLCREQVGPVGNGEFRVIEFGKKFRGRLGRLHHAVTGSPFYAINALKKTGIQPDLIHAHFAFDAVYAAQIAHELRIPLIVTLHGIDVAASDRTLLTSGNASWIKLFMNRRHLGGDASRFLGVSDFICQLAGRHYPRNKIVKGFLGIDESQFEFSSVPDGKMILHIGRMVEKKGAIYLLQALAKVKQEVTDATLVIVGDGPLGSEIKAYIDSHRLRESVRIIPKASREEIASLLKQCRLFCLPSVTAATGDTEGLPVSILEAMAVGRPVLSTFHAGIPEAIEDGKSGYLVKERDVAALADRIKELLVHLELCQSMGAKGRRTIETWFSLSECARETELIYSEVLANETSAKKQ